MADSTAEMDAKLKAEAIQWLASLRGAAEQARGFVLDQAPDTLRELVSLGRVQWAVYLLLGLGGIALGLWLFRLTFSFDWRTMDPIDPHVPMVLIGIIGPTLLVLWSSLFVLIEAFPRCAAAWFAPRIYIIETLAELAGRVAGR